ncbi:CocE/NonD family hydrolase [Rhizosphaericola mali]|uniref:CocE/NonD family hydrolase n=1 Tax=Rhizosphaericola mali TaxID=2545455 RepID=A0A5P2FW05_9BACT|nr:CocE/NonD family hydrolase [Rhizosphaericola mali]QES87696.1 CocE/NonD family hydrolase [Rhizosphaericola mali]
MKKCISLLLIFFACAQAEAQKQLPFDTSYARAHYDKKEIMIPMRDGVKLFTAIYTPKDTSKSYPIMMMRTCYSVRPYGEDKYRLLLGPSLEFMKEGFIFVYQDVRGKNKSEGVWTEITPFIPHITGLQHDEASDTYDAVDWLVKNVSHNNGKVGAWGISYPGFFATNFALSGHPAIKAVSPQAPVTNWFLGDDTHHNGAFFLMDEFDFDYGFANSTNGPNKDKLPRLNAHYTDSYDFFLQMKTVANVNKLYYHNRIPFWDTIMMHPNYDAWWQARDIRKYLYNIKPATLVVGGFYDAEDMWGAQQVYKNIESKNKENENFLVMGPWNHGGWAGFTMDHLGDQQFGSNTSEWFQKNVQFPFFMHYLKGAPESKLPEALLFDAGTNEWKKMDTWPSMDIVKAAIYLNGKDSLSFFKPIAKKSSVEYISDPSKPVPYEDGVSDDRGITYLNADQRFASKRPDVATFTGKELSENTTLAGEITANIYASTTAEDADFVVKIIDVLPDTSASYKQGDKEVIASGYQRLVRAEVMRGRFRNSFEKPEAFVPNKPTLVSFSIPDVLYTFKKGHKIMIQIQSSWFPLVDRNPQTFVDIYTAKETDFKKATITLYDQADMPTSIDLGILDANKQAVWQP